MKIGFFSNLSPDATGGNSLLDSLRARPNVELHKLSLPHLKVSINPNVVFKFKDITLDHTFDLVIIRGGHKDLKTTIEVANYCLKNNIKFFDNNLYKTKYLINKKTDTLGFAYNNLPIPRSYFFNDISNIDFAGESFPIIMKGISSSQGAKVFKINSKDDVLKIIDQTQIPINNFIFQEFINYKADLRVLVVGDKVLGAMKRTPGENEFRANFSLGGSVEKIEISDELKDLALKAAKSCQLEVAGIDILLDQENRPYVLEANRNPGLKGISKALNINVADKVIDFMIDYANTVNR